MDSTFNSSGDKFSRGIDPDKKFVQTTNRVPFNQTQPLQQNHNNHLNAAYAAGRTILPEFISTANKANVFPKPIVPVKNKLSLSKLGDRQLPFALGQGRPSNATHVQIEKYDTHIARGALTNERAKFYLMLKAKGDYEAAYQGKRNAIGEELEQQMLSIEQRDMIAQQYRYEFMEWIQKYDLRRRDTGQRLSVEELDKDIEEWMSQRPSSGSQSCDDPDEETDWQVLERGFQRLVLNKYDQGCEAKVLLTREQLDDDLDLYMSKKKDTVQSELSAPPSRPIGHLERAAMIRMHSTSKSQDELDTDLEEYHLQGARSREEKTPHEGNPENAGHADESVYYDPSDRFAEEDFDMDW